jgi:hypothetical protein
MSDMDVLTKGNSVSETTFFDLEIWIIAGRVKDV